MDDGGEETLTDAFFRRAFVDHAVPMLVVNPASGRIVSANESAAALYGYERRALIGRQVASLGYWNAERRLGSESDVPDESSPVTGADETTTDGPSDAIVTDGSLTALLNGEPRIVRQRTASGDTCAVELRCTRVSANAVERPTDTDASAETATGESAGDGTTTPSEVSSGDAGGETDGLVMAVLEDVTNQQETERRLAERTARTETLNSLLRHDIRNDMAVVSGAVDALRSAIDDTPRELATIDAKVDHVVELTQTARDMTETLHVDESADRSVSLAEVLSEEITEVQASYPEAEVVIDGDLPDVTVVADDLLDAVFRNLLNNAVQHNDRDTPTVRVSATADDDTATVTVADNGPGIPDTQKRRVFERGERGTDSSGTGLGLYLVGTLVDQYGGEVSVADNDPRGTVFTVTLTRRDDSDSDDPFGGQRA